MVAPHVGGHDPLAAIETNTQAAFARWAGGLGAEIHEEADLSWFASGLPFALCNGVIRTSLSAAGADECIETTLRHFRERSIPMCWLVGPSSQPTDLGARLQRYGLIHAEDGPGMALELSTLDDAAPLPAGLIIGEVDDGASLKEWIDALCIGTGFPAEVMELLYALMERHGLNAAHGLRHHPSIRLFLGALDGQPVATALLFLAAGVAGLYDVSTAPAARRRGMGAALSYAALRTARDLGYRMCILQSSEKGEGVYRRLGFQQYCTMSLYVWSPD